MTGTPQKRRAGELKGLRSCAAARVAAGLHPAGWLLLVLLCGVLISPLAAQSPFAIQSVSPGFVPAGANSATLVVTGHLPDFTQGQDQLCFYTGTSSPAITPAVANGIVVLTIPGDTIQAIAPSLFTAANNYSVAASLYLVTTGTACTGTPDPTLSNHLSVPVAEPSPSSYFGPTAVPQTNPTANGAAPPFQVVLTGNFFADSTVVSFGSFGAVTPKLLSTSALSIAVPAAFTSSPAGTTAAVSVCGANSYCSGATAAVTLTVAALTPSAGSLTITPTPVSPTGTTVLTAHFTSAAGAPVPPIPGVPTGLVTFTAAGATGSTGTLTMDPTATLIAQNTTTQVAATAAPTLSPAAGSYMGAQTLTIADVTPGAVIYYTTDGSAPSAASMLYTGPFAVNATETVTAIAIATGYAGSAPAAGIYTIVNLTPVALAFVAQPTTTGIGAAITPPVTVAIVDMNGNTVTNSSLPVNLALSANPGETTLGGTLTANAVSGIATFADLSLGAIANGYSLLATSRGLTRAVSTTFNITPPPIIVQLFNPLIGVGSTLPGTITLSQPAPTGGVVVTLVSSATNFVTVSAATLTIAAGQTTGTFTYTGVAPGPTTITASAANYFTGSSTVTATYSLVSLGTIPPVAPGQTVSLALSIATAAPAGGVTIYFTSSNSSVATVTPSVFIPEGQRTAATNPQIVGLVIGTTVINATAEGYAPDTRTVNVTVVAAFNPGSIALPLTTSNNISLTISAPAIAGGLTFTLSSDTPATATVPASVTIPQGATSVPVPVTGVANGQTTVRADSPGVTEATLGVNVTSTLGVNLNTTGVDTQMGASVSLPSTSPTPVTVTITSSNPAVALLSSSSTTVGTATLTFSNITTGIPSFYVQGQALGTATITASAPAYTTGTAVETVDASGFAFDPYSGNTITTTTFATPTAVNIVPAVLDPTTLDFVNFATLNPGIGPFNVPIVSSSTHAGTITVNPVVFVANDTLERTAFQPVSAGTSNLTFGPPPAPFQIAPQYNTIVATVSAPALTVSSVTAGVNLETNTSINVPTPPATPETVTVTISDPTIALISSSSTTVGTASLTFSTASVPNIYVQGLKVGAATLTATAAGYTTGTGTITVYPSAFVFDPYYYGNFSTTTFSSASGLSLIPAIVDPMTSNFYNFGTISPGVGPFSIPVVSSNTAVGTITTTPLIFHSGDSSQSTSFQPASAGSTNLTPGTQPAGFTTPANYNLMVATVTAPALGVSTTTSGVNVQVAANVSVPVSPPSPEMVTVTVMDPTLAALSTNSATVGTSSVTFSTSAVPTLYVQGLKVGSTMLVASAAGYTNGAAVLTVDPSGFLFNPYDGNLSTTTFSGPSSFEVVPALLDPTTLNFNGFATVSPGAGPFGIAVVSSDTNVGSITTTPVVFHAGDTSQTTSFQPTSAGTSTITLGAQPTGFKVSGNYTALVATVTAPMLGVSNAITGANLESTLSVSLPVAPPNPVTVTVTSNGPSIATISSSGTVVGGTTLTFSNVTASGYLPTIYLQGQTVGTTTVTASAPGYTNGIGNITVYPSGFTFAGSYSGGLSTTAGASAISIPVYPSILNPGALSYYDTALLNPGLGSVQVVLTDSNASAGTILTPLSFVPADQYEYTMFTPLATGTTNLTIVQPAGFSTPTQYIQIPATVQ